MNYPPQPPAHDLAGTRRWAAQCVDIMETKLRANSERWFAERRKEKRNG